MVTPSRRRDATAVRGLAATVSGARPVPTTEGRTTGHLGQATAAGARAGGRVAPPTKARTIRRRRLAPVVRGGGWRLGALVAGGVLAAGGCAVHNPTDLAQRRPVIPAATSGTAPAGSARSFDSHAAVRVLARLGYGRARPHQIPPGPLRAFVASCRSATTTPCLNIFFFYGDKYAGAAFARPQPKVSIKKQDGRLVRTVVPGPKGGFRNVRYMWTGQEVVGLANTGTVPLVRVPAH